jgi:hydroxymethylglutaryl-CoA lyase
MKAPLPIPLEGMPKQVCIYEVGPRDGLQNEDNVVPVDVKAEFVRRLVDAGLKAVELTSFVPAHWVPQLGDAEELLGLLGPMSGRHPALVPNDRGLDRALSAGVSEIAIYGSATESFAQRNLDGSVAASLKVFSPLVRRARISGLSVRGYVSMCFGDPWEGEVATMQAADAVLALADLGCTEVSLGDTIGVATPGQVVALLDELDRRGLPKSAIAVHFHDTLGQGLANTIVALQHGVTTVDTSAGGLGGCPYAGSQAGNLATEDLVWLLDGLGIDTGIDLEALSMTSLWMANLLGRPSPSRVLRALTPASRDIGNERVRTDWGVRKPHRDHGSAAS